MRGFPLFNTLLVAALLLVAWWPLRQLATNSMGGEARSQVEDGSGSGAFSDPDESGLGESLPLELRVLSSVPLKHLRIEYLGEPLIDEAGRSGEWIQTIHPFAIPPEGVEFWVEAEFAESGSDGRAALGIELTPSDRGPLTRTIWSEGESIADTVVFRWDE